MASNLKITNATPTRTYSFPDITNLRDDEDSFPNAGLIKRRRLDDGNNLTSLFETFASKIESSLATMNQTINDSIKMEISKLSLITSEIRSEVNCLRSESSEVKNSVKELSSKQFETSTQLGELIQTSEFNSERIKDLEERASKLENLSKPLKDISTMKSVIKDLKKQLNQQQQRDRVCNIEIVGIPELKSEDLEDRLIRLAKHGEVTISLDDIDHVNRV